jgi:hypothetical protein
MTVEQQLVDLEKRVTDLERLTQHMRPLGPTIDYAELEEERTNDAKCIADALALQKQIDVPVDRNARTLTDGSPVTPDHREIDPVTGMQKAYVVLSQEERARGFVRPVRRTYTHRPCGTNTTMGLALAETYARDPKFYVGTFCCHCKEHRPLVEFVWTGTNEQVGQ